MNKAFTRIFIVSFFPLIALLIIWMIVVSSWDYSDSFSPYRLCKHTPQFHLEHYLKGIDNSDATNDFPYTYYVDSADYCDINSIIQDLHSMDSWNPQNHDQNMDILIVALTTKKQKIVNSELEKYNPDFLFSVLQWAERFHNYADLDAENAYLYETIYDHWMKIVSDKLVFYAKDKYSISHSYKFKYLESRCSENLYPVAYAKSAIEKISLNAIHCEWSYLWNRFWNGTTVLYKIVILLLVILTCYGYISIFRFHLLRKKQ